MLKEPTRKMFKVHLSILVCAIFVTTGCSGHTYHAGRCPEVEPMPNFDMTKFLGMWYAIEKTTTFSSCLTYNFVKGSIDGEYDIEQESQNVFFKGMPFKHIYRYTGRITRISDQVPSLMFVKFPLNLIGNAFFTVFATDYVNYAGIFTCQNMGFLHRLSVTILARSATLEGMEINNMHRFLQKYPIDISDLNPIKHSDCPRQDAETIVIDIDHDFFENFNNHFQESGISVAATGRSEKDMESTENSSEMPNLSNDAEWIHM